LDVVTSLFRKKIAGNTTVHAQMKAECIQTSYVVYKFNYIRYEWIKIELWSAIYYPT